MITAASGKGAVRLRRPSAVQVARALVALAVLCFLLPFGTVSCSKTETVEVTGVELATRSVPGAGLNGADPNFAQKVENEAFGWALIALLLPLGVVLLSRTRPEAIGKAFLLTVAAIVFLLRLPMIAVEALADVTLGVGFVGALALEVLAGTLYAVLLIRRRLARRAAARASAAVAAVVAALAVTAGCSATPSSGPTSLDECVDCGVRSVLGWRQGSRQIVFSALSRSGVPSRYAVDVESGKVANLPGRPRRPKRAWTRSRDRYAVVRDDRILVRSRDGRPRGTPTLSCASEYDCFDEVFDSSPSWSPDGRWLVFARSTSDTCGFCLPPGYDFSTGLGVAHPDGNGFHWAIEGEVDPTTTVAWSPNGRHIAYAKGGALYVLEVDGRGEAHERPRLLVVA